MKSKIKVITEQTAAAFEYSVNQYLSNGWIIQHITSTGFIDLTGNYSEYTAILSKEEVEK